MNWRPTADIELLRERARFLALIRAFFAERDVLEVETPLLCSSGITDPSIEALIVPAGDSLSSPRFLQTSPEYAMKRLLAAYGEPMYQITRAFRAGEAGSRHNPEFTLLEWYRPGFDHHALMREVAELVALCLGERSLNSYSYRALMQKHLALDPFTVQPQEIESRARELLDVGDMRGDSDLWLDLLMSHIVEPRLADEGMCFVYDYPPSQAALSRIVETGGVPVGQRFELYVDGLELANGYCELTDASEQRRRFEADNARRRHLGLPERPVDETLLAALEHGLCDCSGVALGLDRLLMLSAGLADIRQSVAFSWERC